MSRFRSKPDWELVNEARQMADGLWRNSPTLAHVKALVLLIDSLQIANAEQAEAMRLLADDDAVLAKASTGIH
jgi:hypothetical protein